MNLPKVFLIPFKLFRISFSSSKDLDLSLRDGSPTLLVHPPTKTIGLWPKS